MPTHHPITGSPNDQAMMMARLAVGRSRAMAMPVGSMMTMNMAMSRTIPDMDGL